MSQVEFEKQIALLKNRIHTLLLARRGALQMKKTRIEEHKVPGYTMPTHTRVTYSRKERRAS